MYSFLNEGRRTNFRNMTIKNAIYRLQNNLEFTQKKVQSVCQNTLKACKWFFCVSLLLPYHWRNEWNTAGGLHGNVVPRKSFIVTVKTSVIKDIIPIYYAFHHTCSDHKLYILQACHFACAVFVVTLYSNIFSMQLREYWTQENICPVLSYSCICINK
jgi:hypothetical protein